MCQVFPPLNLIFSLSQRTCKLGGIMCYLNNNSCLKVISALFVEEHKNKTCGSLGFLFEILNGIK